MPSGRRSELMTSTVSRIQEVAIKDEPALIESCEAVQMHLAQTLNRVVLPLYG